MNENTTQTIKKILPLFFILLLTSSILVYGVQANPTKTTDTTFPVEQECDDNKQIDVAIGEVIELTNDGCVNAK